MLDTLLVLAPYLPVVRNADVVDVVVRGGVLDVSDGVACLAAEKDPTSLDTFRVQEYATLCSFDEGRI